MSLSKKIKSLAICILLLGCGVASSQDTKKVYPTATDPEIFRQEIETLLRATNAIGDGYGGPYDRELENRTRQDPRDWESALAQIIRGPGKSDFRLGEAAICVAQLRKSFHHDEVVSASEEYFDVIVQDALRKISEFESRGEKVPYWVNVKASGRLSQLLDFHDPRLLLMALRYFNSDAAVKLGMLDKSPVQKIPLVLRACGNATHREEALSLSNKLKQAGNPELAGGIEKWAQRVGSKSSQNFDDSQGLPQAMNKNSIPKETKSAAVYWSLIGIASTVVIVSGFFAWRRSPK